MLKRIASEIMLILLLIGVLTSAFNIQPVRAATITVPDDYQTIQEAINAANSGDTIYVEAGTYYENVVVNKTVSLLGENKESTTIDGNGEGTVVYVEADNVNVTCFTIQNSTSSSGIYIASDHCTISDNL